MIDRSSIDRHRGAGAAGSQGHVTARHPGNRVRDDVTACGAASAAAAAAAGMQCTVAYCCSALLYGQLN